MAQKATIFKAELQIADMDRNYYQTHTLTLARHPSETDQRMMVRLLAFALNASETLEFTRGLSSDDEPDVWQKSFSDEIELWIELGQADEKRIKKACGRARQVIIYTYNQRSADIWWQQIKNKLTRFDNLSVVSLPEAAVQSLTEMTQRTMRLQCNIQERVLSVSDENGSVQVEPVNWK